MKYFLILVGFLIVLSTSCLAQKEYVIDYDQAISYENMDNNIKSAVSDICQIDDNCLGGELIHYASGWQVDLDDDGIKEWIINFQWGTSNAEFFFLTSRNNVWKVFYKYSCSPLVIGNESVQVESGEDLKKIGATKTNGVYDIYKSSGHKIYWNGKTYVDSDDEAQTGQGNQNNAQSGQSDSSQLIGYVVSGDDVNVRKTPTTQSEALAQLQRNQCIISDGKTVSNEGYEWLQMMNPVFNPQNGRLTIGYVTTKFVKTNAACQDAISLMDAIYSTIKKEWEHNFKTECSGQYIEETLSSEFYNWLEAHTSNKVKLVVIEEKTTTKNIGKSDAVKHMAEWLGYLMNTDPESADGSNYDSFCWFFNEASSQVAGIMIFLDKIYFYTDNNGSIIMKISLENVGFEYIFTNQQGTYKLTQINEVAYVY